MTMWHAGVNLWHFGILLLMLDILQLAESTGEIQDMHSTN